MSTKVVKTTTRTTDAYGNVVGGTTTVETETTTRGGANSTTTRTTSSWSVPPDRLETLRLRGKYPDLTDFSARCLEYDGDSDPFH
jgi:hypothetical protein